MPDGPDDRSTGRGAWAEPGVFTVAPGVHRMPLPLPMDGLRAVNVYVLETADGLTLVDGGWAIPASRELFDAGLRSLGHTARDVRRFLVTHMHRDHYTQARVIASEFGGRVSLGVGDRPNLERVLTESDGAVEDAHLLRLRGAGAEHLHAGWVEQVPSRPPDRGQYSLPDDWLVGDLVLDLGDRRLHALATPGHTQGHYVFADPEASLLFAGDHVLSTITPSIGFEPAHVQQPLRDFLSSLAKVRALPDLTLLPAHGPVTGSSHQRVDELLAFHEARLDASLAAVHGGARTAWEVAQVLRWTRRERHLDELGVFDQALATFETQAHLELLALRGRVAREAGETVVFGPLREAAVLPG